MLINSELPLCMLNENNALNEYDFVLFHLYDSNEDYREYFRNQRLVNPNRLMIFDNSAYEYFIKGEKLDLMRFYRTIYRLKPDFYITPDVLMDKQKTLELTSEFISFCGEGINVMTNGQSKPLSVIQGNSVDDFLDIMNCYKDMGIQNIAIPFHNSFYKELGLYSNDDIQNEFADTYKQPVTEDMLYAMGRIQFIRNYEEYLKDFDHVHFLGSHCPLEKMFYKNYQTMDTGYPVKLAMVGDELFKEKSKPNIIIDEFLEKELDNKTRELIKDNIKKFKMI